ncbi:MAG: PIN domain-containing protein [Deltaproteobacteria bacterium]|nr:PIN domain-containing protein [Deltaproteobacteria bacterium]
MIVVDTSVWIAFFRGHPDKVAAGLDHLIEADDVALAVPVRIEILGGARSVEIPRLQRLLDALPCWAPTGETWTRIESWLAVASRRGQRFGMGDLLVAAIAAEHDAPVWSLDRDFERMARLGFIELLART